MGLNIESIDTTNVSEQRAKKRIPEEQDSLSVFDDEGVTKLTEKDVNDDPEINELKYLLSVEKSKAEFRWSPLKIPAAILGIVCGGVSLYGLCSRGIPKKLKGTALAFGIVSEAVASIPFLAEKYQKGKSSTKYNNLIQERINELNSQKNTKTI